MPTGSKAVFALSLRLQLCVVVFLATLCTGASAAELAQLRIGYQKSSVNLLVARRFGFVEHRFPNVQVKWVEFTAGPQLLEALGAGSLDFGMTGDTPPIFAQAAGRDILYVGQEPPKPHSSAILVQRGSGISSLAGLRGKRVAFQRGSSAHYLLLRALEKGGLRLSDIQPIYLAPADARAAFERRSVDAWAIWDPYWAAAATGAQAEVLVTGEGLSDNVTFYESSRQFAKEHPEAIQTLMGAINDADQYVRSHRAEASALVAATTGLDLQSASTFLARRQDSPVNALNPGVVAGQQEIADAFAKAGVIPREIKVADAVWHPEPVASAGPVAR
jgi:sulfonate transport system substrate-binding protein